MDKWLAVVQNREFLRILTLPEVNYTGITNLINLSLEMWLVKTGGRSSEVAFSAGSTVHVQFHQMDETNMHFKMSVRMTKLY